MKLSTNLKIAAVVIGALPVALGTMNSAQAAGDPTSGRIEVRQREYNKCVNFSKRVLGAALSQSKGDRKKINAAYAHYFGNVERCRKAFL